MTGRRPKTLNDGGPLGDLDKAGLLTLPPLRPGHHHVGVAAPARRTNEPLAPLGNSCLGGAKACELVGIRFGPIAHHTTSRRCADANAAAEPVFISCLLHRTRLRKSIKSRIRIRSQEGAKLPQAASNPSEVDP